MTNITDVVILFHSKDFALLPWCVKGIKNNIRHGDIYIVSAEENKSEIEKIGAIWVDENKVIDGLTIHSNTNARWGWYFQQLLKFGMADIVKTDYYLVVDSDTVFLRKVNFFNDQGKPFYVPTTEYHLPYFEKINQLFNFPVNREYSFIAHHMIFSRQFVREMCSQMKGNGKWYVNLLEGMKIDTTVENQSNFSEYETYGHYLKEKHPEEVNLRQLKWMNIQYPPNRYILSRLASEFDFCSFHKYQLIDFHPSSKKELLCYYYKFEVWLRMIKKDLNKTIT